MLLSAFHNPTSWALMASPVGLQLFAIDWLRASWQTRAAWIKDEKDRFHALLDSVGLSSARFASVSGALSEVMDGHTDLSEFDATVEAFKADCHRDLAALNDPERMARFDGVLFRVAALRDYAMAITDLRGALLRPE
jgi:hypothetical protein